MAWQDDEWARQAVAIWQAGVDAVDSCRLVRENVHVRDGVLRVRDVFFPLDSIRRIVVVGGGKAGAGMAEGLVSGLGPTVVGEKQLSGWINVPDDCVRDVPPLHLHGGRPAGSNEPHPTGEQGSREMVRRLRDCHPDDLVICLLSGGGSALMPLPKPGVTLADKLAITRLLSGAGADIHQLNTVRRALSDIKGGGLLRACRANRLVTLILSDVLGDPLDVIASGPTVPVDDLSHEAWRILQKLLPDNELVPPSVQQLLAAGQSAVIPAEPVNSRLACHNIVIGNNQTALSAAARHAAGLGMAVQVLPTHQREPTAETVGQELMELLLSTNRGTQAPWCILSGGEPTVKLAAEALRGRGGRNQQLVLASLVYWLNRTTGTKDQTVVNPEGQLVNVAGPPLAASRSDWALVSGGTDGEDGPTDAAGAVLWEQLARRMLASQARPADYLARNDAYTFFADYSALLKTGPTHTNVCDLRVMVGA